MRINRTKGLIAGLFLAATSLLGVAPTTAEAQTEGSVGKPRRVIVYRTYNPFWYRRYDPLRDPFYYRRTVVIDPIAHQRERGYREGKGEGEEDARKGRASNPKGPYPGDDEPHVN